MRGYMGFFQIYIVSIVCFVFLMVFGAFILFGDRLDVDIDYTKSYETEYLDAKYDLEKFKYDYVILKQKNDVYKSTIVEVKSSKPDWLTYLSGLSLGILLSVLYFRCFEDKILEYFKKRKEKKRGD